MAYGLFISIPPITITNTHPCNRFSIAIISSLIIAITITLLRQNLKMIFCNSTYEVGIYPAFLLQSTLQFCIALSSLLGCY